MSASQYGEELICRDSGVIDFLKSWIQLAVAGEISTYGQSISFLVGDSNILKEGDSCGAGTGDVNCDSSVDLIDFSIAAYWYQRSNPPSNSDLNNDGKVDLVDFSIMAYYWTG